MRDTPSASVVAGAPLTHAVVAAARPIQLLPAVTLSLSPAPFSAAQAGPPLLSEAGQRRELMIWDKAPGAMLAANQRQRRRQLRHFIAS